MNQLIKLGRFLYGIGIAAVGLHQIIIKGFRSEVVPPFPALSKFPSFLPILIGAVLILAGVAISGLINIRPGIKRNISLYLGLGFLLLFITCQVPYVFLYNSDKLLHIDYWYDAAEELAYCGGAFVMAGSFFQNDSGQRSNNSLIVFLEKFIPIGGIFFSALMILFGFSHYVFIEIVSTMVPKWFGVPFFWTYLTGTALIAAGLAICLKIWIKPVALLLAIMLFFFFIFFHIPDAAANPNANGGAEIVRAFVALLFCGIALGIALTSVSRSLAIQQS